MIYKIAENNCIVDVNRQVIFICSNTNTDFQQFKSDIASGAELQDAEGNVMTAEQVQEFLATLP